MANKMAWMALALILAAAAPGWAQEKPRVIYSRANAPAAARLDDLPLKTSVSQYGMTWTFSAPAHVGQFINGDHYVVGPVTVTAIDPMPLYASQIPADQIDPTDKRQPEDSRVRNGFMLNPPAARQVSYDSGIKNWFAPSLIQKLPVAMKPGDSLVTTISMPMGLVVVPPLSLSNEKETRGDGDASPVKDAAVLTCVAGPLPADAFRPAFCDRTQKIDFAHDLKRELLPALEMPADAPKPEEYIRFTQRPWVNTGFFGFEVPAENMPWYGREIGRVTGNTALLLCGNLSPEKKEPLLENFVQVGIDLGGMIRAGHPGWYCWGGMGTGRKIPIVLAGLLLGDEELANINKSFPRAAFGEDEQTAYGECWTGAKVVFTGHSGIDEITGVGRDYARGPQAWGPYEHTQPATWGPGQKTSEGYRRTSTTVGFVAQALALHLLHGEKAWGHDAFFDYVDRWMLEKDDAFIQTIKAGTGVDYDKDWCRQGQCWDTFVNEMWARYRVAPGMPPSDGWQKPHDETDYKTAIEKEPKAPTQRR